MIAVRWHRDGASYRTNGECGQHYRDAGGDANVSIRRFYERHPGFPF
jgi:hypothetical protein